MTDILMVCVRQDVARTKALAEMFLSAGFSIGDGRASDSALRSSAAAVLIWSHASVRSASFRDASRRAIRAGRALIVNLINPSSRPARIGCSPIFDLARWAGDSDDAVLGPLRQAVASMVKEFRAQVEHWRTIRHCDEASAFVDYLARYGLDAAFSDAAEQRLDEIAFGALVGVRAPSAELEPVAEDSRLRSAPVRRRTTAAARNAQTNHDSAPPRESAPYDEDAAPTSSASKRRSRSPSARTATSSGNARERVVAVGHESAEMSPESLWAPRGAPMAERDALARSRAEDAPHASCGENWASLQQVVRAAMARLALDLRNLQHRAVTKFGSWGVALHAGIRRKSGHASESKFGASRTTAPYSERASVEAKHPLQSRRAAPVIRWSAIERAIAHYLVLGRRIARHPIAIAPLVIGAALAGVLYWSGSASNMARTEADIGIETAKAGQVVHFDESESADRSPAHSLEASPVAAQRARRTKVVAASSISMSSNDSSAPAASPDAASRASSDTEPLLFSGSLTTETFAFDLAPNPPQSVERAPARVSMGGAFGSSDPKGAPLLRGSTTSNEVLAHDTSAGLVLPAQQDVYCPDTAPRVDMAVPEWPAPEGRGSNCLER